MHRRLVRVALYVTALSFTVVSALVVLYAAGETALPSQARAEIESMAEKMAFLGGVAITATLLVVAAVIMVLGVKRGL